MTDSSIKKVQADTAPEGALHQKYLASGKRVSMRMWENTPPGQAGDAPYAREYESVGYVIAGRAELEIEGQTVLLEPGDSWMVPADARHIYRIQEPFTAVEACAPPARIEGRD